MNNMNWKRISDYARDNNIALQSAYNRIKKGKLQTKKIKGITYVNDDASGVSAQPVNDSELKANAEWLELQNDQKKIKNEIQIQKLRNLRNDAILKQLKQKEIKQKYRREFAQEFFDCLTQSFGDVKSFLIELQLNKEQNDKLKNAFKKSIEKFRKKLTEHLRKKQDEQNGENDNGTMETH